MTRLSLREAATTAGTSKSTILRAIQSGRMSAPRTDDGGYAIDPAELFRVYPPKSDDDGDQSVERDAGHGAPGQGVTDDVELLLRNARLEGELASLKALLEAERRRSEELREDRDRWHVQAERFALAPPIPPPPASQASPAQRPEAKRDGLSGAFLGLFRRAG